MTTDVAQLIDEIHDLLSSNDLVSPDRAQDLSSRYGAACDEVNRRLREAHLRLDRGLRSEAIQICEEEPNLLDLVSLLDIPSRADFCEMLSLAGVETPPRVAVELAAALNDAYAAELPLKNLLKQHRLLALRRAPLVERVRLLRRIADADAGQATWVDDLKDLEAARTRELREEVRLGFLNDDLDGLRQLLEELHEDGWRSPPHQALCNDLQSKVDELAARRARCELGGVETALNQAHAALDVDEGRLARTRWQELSAIARLDPQDPTHERMAPALEWLTNEDERHRQETLRDSAALRLEQALEEEVTRQSLEAAYREASRYEGGVSSQLERRFHERLQEMELADLRRRRLKTAMVAATVLGLAGITVSIGRAYRRAEAISAAQAVLKNHIEAAELDEAVIHLEGLPEEIQRSEAVQSLSLDLRRLVTAEQARLRQFETALKRFEEAGLNPPDLASLNLAEKLARRPGEKEQVGRMRDAAEVAELERMNRDTKDFLRQIQAFTDELSPGRTIPEVRLKAIESELDSLLDRFGHLTPALRGQGDSLRSRVQDMRRVFAESQAREELQQQVTAAIGDLGAYVRALQSLAEQESDVSAQESLRQVIRDESRTWDALSRWSSLGSQPAWNSLATLDSQDAAKMHEELRSVTKQLEEQVEVTINFREELQAKQRMLEKIVSRSKNNVATLERLVQLGNNPLMRGMGDTGLWLIKAGGQEGRPARHYYSFKNPAGSENEDTGAKNSSVQSVVVEYLKDVGSQATGRARRRTDGLEIEEAPQAILSKRLQDITTEVGPASLKNGLWEGRFSQLIEEVYKQPDLDDVLRIILLKQVIEVAIEGSSSFEIGYLPVLKSLRAAPVDTTVNWVDPDDDAANEARERATATLARLRSPLQEAKRAAAERYRSDVASFSERLRWVGWLARESHGRPVAHFHEPDVDGSVIILAMTGAKATSREVGTAVRGTLSWNQTGDLELKYGRPLFVRLTPEGSR